MSKRMFLGIALVLVLAAGSIVGALAGPGPAPNAGDGIPDGSGFVVTPGPIGDGSPLGPNPLAGDGVSDGSSLPAPYGPIAI